MKILVRTVLLAALFFATTCPAQEIKQKLRVMVLTDIENEPDDTQSMIRFLTYSNQWDIEGLIATTSVHQKTRTAGYKIKELVRAYGKVRNNLLLHEKGFPDIAYLLDRKSVV